MNKKSRIRNPFKHLSTYISGDKIYIGKQLLEDDSDLMKALGFFYPYIIGECVLPASDLSKPLFDNSEGKLIIRKELPKETRYRYFEWSWEDFQGTEYSDSKYIPYERYYREHQLPLAVELSIVEDKNKNKYVVSDLIEVCEDNLEILQLVMNIFISVFGEFKTFNSELCEPVTVIRKVPWEVLRPGQNSDEEISERIDTVLSKYSDTKKNMCKHCIDKLRKSTPNVISIGKAGFSGYMVFDYPEKKIAILESFLPNNATYVLDKSWEEISKLTKTQVLDNKLHIDRIYHCNSWDKQVDGYIA